MEDFTMSVIKWKRYKGEGGGWVGHVFGVPLYRLWFIRHETHETSWVLGVWIENQRQWQRIDGANTISFSTSHIKRLKESASKHFAEHIQHHLEALLLSIKLVKAESVELKTDDAEPIILKFPDQGAHR
jgi:hypothetical protein